MQQQNIGNQLREFFLSKSLLSSIIAANIIIWLFTLLFGVVEYLFCLGNGTASTVWMEWFALSSEPMALLFRPWTLVTYMFLHANLWHLVWNMVMLYFAGTMCCRYLSIRKFGWIYFLSGIVGGLLYVLLFNFFPVFRFSTSTLVGASAGVLGVFMAVAAYMPNQEVGIWPFKTLRVKMIYLALFFVLMDLLSIPASNAGGHIAHLGGALFGFLYVWCGKKGTFDFLRQRHDRPKKNLRFTRESKKKASQHQRPVSDEEYNKRRHDDQKRVDAILDKISRSGYESLSKEEKAFLFNYKA